MAVYGQNTGFKSLLDTSSNNTAWVCGDNVFGELGNGTTINSTSVIQLGSLNNWNQISSSGYSLFSIKTDGTLWSCGYNKFGQLGNGTVNIYYSSPIQVGALTNWSKISGGGPSAVAIKTDGTLWSWGYNGYGQLGNGTITSYSSPIQIGALTTWSQISCGYSLMALKNDGSLWVCGYNRYGNLGNNTTLRYSSPIQIGALTTWSQISNLTLYSAALKTDGTVWTWGRNNFGQLGNGTIVDYSSPIQVGSSTNWKQLANHCNSSHVVAIKTDGTLWSWGYNQYGQIGNGTTLHYSSPVQVGALTTWKQAATGSWHTLAIKTDGSLWAWGNAGFGQLGNEKTVPNYSSPVQIGTLYNWKQVSCGYYSTFMIQDIKTQDLGQRYVSKDYLLDVYPNIASAAGARTAPGLWTGGYNNYGQLGNGNTIYYSSPIQIGALTNWKQVAGGFYCTLAVKTDGTLWACGYNDYGALGNGTTINYSSPIQIGALTTWKQVSTSLDQAVQGYSLAVRTDGALVGWGGNFSGQLGNSTTTNRSIPQQVGSDLNWKLVACGYGNFLAIKSNGTLWGCGYNYGNLGNGTTINYSSPIQIGALTNWKQVGIAKYGPSAAVKTDGTLWTWGTCTYGELGNGTVSINYSSPIQIGALTNWKQVACGQHFVAAVKNDGTLWTWGYNAQGRLGYEVEQYNTRAYYSSPIQVGSLSTWANTDPDTTAVSGYGGMSYTSAAIKSDGTLWTWGYNAEGQLGNGTTTNYSSPIQIGALTNWKQISTGTQSSSAIKTDGTLWTWGRNLKGNLGNGTTIDYSSPIQVGSLTNWNQVSSSGGLYRFSAIKTDGTLWSCGYNRLGELGNGTTIDYSSPIQVGSLTNWKQVATGYQFSTAIKTDGTLWTWGRNDYGQLGNGNTIYYSSPIQIGALTNWKQVSCGAYHAAAIKTDGTLWTCGYNSGTAGNGTLSVHYSSPIQVGSLTNWKQVSCGEYYTAAVKTDGTLWACGYNNYGALGNGTTTKYSSPIQIGALNIWNQVVCNRYHTMAYTSTGRLYAWGYNLYGQLGARSSILGNTSSPQQVGSLTNWKQVSLSPYNNGAVMALKTDGTLWAWGDNAFGRLGIGIGNDTNYSSPIQVGLLTNWKQVAVGYQHFAAISDGYF